MKVKYTFRLNDEMDPWAGFIYLLSISVDNFFMRPIRTSTYMDTIIR